MALKKVRNRRRNDSLADTGVCTGDEEAGDFDAVKHTVSR
jgi:hypothetical protein